MLLHVFTKRLKTSFQEKLPTRWIQRRFPEVLENRTGRALCFFPAETATDWGGLAAVLPANVNTVSECRESSRITLCPVGLDELARATR